MDMQAILEKGPLLFDGAMGTYLAEKEKLPQCEEANLLHPELVAEIHRAYIAAGARAIKTNTFALSGGGFTRGREKELLEAGVRLAREAAGDAALVFGDLGPAGGSEDPAAVYIRLADLFLEAGIRYFLLETLSEDTGVCEAAAHIKKRDPGAFLLVSFAVQPDGFTQKGQLARDLFRRGEACGDIDALGLNCMTSAGHMGRVVSMLGEIKKPLSLMPNAGYPTVLGRRTYYQGDPAYFAARLRELQARGAAILGGCCGTTPAHIAAAAEALKEPLPQRVRIPENRSPEPEDFSPDNPFWEALADPDRKPVAVELDPPEAADVTKFIAGARQLRDSGADIITIADCPIARARMDSSLLAAKLQRELGVQALPHMTCRDRNLNATKALLLGLCAEGVRNVLVVTGDPIPSASRDEVKSVYNFNSRMLAGFIRGLNETALPSPFRIFGALNVNARNFRVQLGLAREKEEKGMAGFLTQPVLTEAALENLKEARVQLAGKLLGGIIPIVSHRNAVFMDSEVSGISVGSEIIRRYEGLDRAAGEELALELSLEAAKKMAPYVDGFYLITPFGRTALMARILEGMRAEGLI